MTLRAIDCQGFAGGFTTGVVQAGFHLVGKREMQAGFGAANCEVNRHILGHCWETETVEPREWSVPNGGAEFVFGNPPCSGFSNMSSKDFRGIESPINHCMWAFVEYVAKVRPYVAVFESVTAAFTQGRPLMQRLREHLAALTNQDWHLYHVVHDARALGGPATRRRYFFVVSRIPFGVEHPTLTTVPTLADVLGDLHDMPLTWDEQPYRSPGNAWTKHRRSGDGFVDGHVVTAKPFASRVADLANMVEWEQGDNVEIASKKCYEQYGMLPPSWDYATDRLIEKDFKFGFIAITRWRSDNPGRVITGAGPLTAVHPWQNRALTYRETARLMGFPDEWKIMPSRYTSGLDAWWGKGITVDAGKWIATWVKNSLEGRPGTLTAETIGDDEYYIAVKKPRTVVYYDIMRERRQHRRKNRLVSVTSNEGEQQSMEDDDTQDVAAETSTESTDVPNGNAGTEKTEKTEKSESGQGRGRPRPNDVVVRDSTVLEALTVQHSGGATREELAEATGLESHRVYQSLWRLRRDGHVTRDRNGRSHTWKSTGN